MILLDTNVVSEVMDVRCDASVRIWFDQQDRDELYLTAINLSEVQFGIALLPEGRRKQGLQRIFAELRKRLAAQVLSFDEAASIAYAELMSRTRANGFAVSEPDGQIAAIARVHGCTVATRDTAPFVAAGVAVVNPWEASS